MALLWQLSPLLPLLPLTLPSDHSSNQTLPLATLLLNTGLKIYVQLLNLIGEILQEIEEKEFSPSQ